MFHLATSLNPFLECVRPYLSFLLFRRKSMARQLGLMQPAPNSYMAWMLTNILLLAQRAGSVTLTRALGSNHQTAAGLLLEKKLKRSIPNSLVQQLKST